MGDAYRQRRRFLTLLGLSAVAGLACTQTAAQALSGLPTLTPGAPAAGGGSDGSEFGRTTAPLHAAPCEPEPPAVVPPLVPSPAAFAAYAEQMRQQAVAAGDQSFGAIVVVGDRVVGLGPSRVVVNRDPTAHAEMEAIRDAARRLGTADLSGAELYSTSRPCRMCETAAYWARVARMWHGAGPADGGSPRYS